MRIGTPPLLYQAKVPAVPAVPLSPEVSKALIASGVFQHPPGKIVWSASNRAAKALGGPVDSVAAANLPGGVTLHPLLAPDNDILFPTLLSVGQQALPVLEASRVDVVADAVAVLVAAPEIFKALTRRSSRSKGEQFYLCAVNFFRVLGLANKVVPVPHVEQSLDVIATVFQVGEQVFLSGENKAV